MPRLVPPLPILGMSAARGRYNRHMTGEPYGTLAGVYDWLVPDALLEPEGSVAAFASVVDGLAPAARVLDCAAGTGQLAVGLALRGFDVVASDVSSAMIECTQVLAARNDVALHTVVCPWEELDRQSWRHAFDAVFCVGNSLTHAVSASGRRTALAAMAGVLREDGLLVVTSRNWELLRDLRPGLQVDDRLTERAGGRGLVVRGWTFPEDWDEPHHLDVAVAVLGDTDTDPEAVATRSERLTFWPFRYEAFERDLAAGGFAVESSTFTPDAERYLVTARRSR